MVITFKQAKKLVECFECEDNPEEHTYVLVRSENYPNLQGPEGLYAYHTEYPDEGLVFLGSD
jgi:hypothetical protein